jgi:hypothetical protein
VETSNLTYFELEIITAYSDRGATFSVHRVQNWKISRYFLLVDLASISIYIYIYIHAPFNRKSERRGL